MYSLSLYVVLQQCFKASTSRWEEIRHYHCSQVIRGFACNLSFSGGTLILHNVHPLRCAFSHSPRWYCLVAFECGLRLPIKDENLVLFHLILFNVAKK